MKTIKSAKKIEVPLPCRPTFLGGWGQGPRRYCGLVRVLDVEEYLRIPKNT